LPQTKKSHVQIAKGKKNEKGVNVMNVRAASAL
jgi:hypothetical protein